ncbi:response regulator [Paenibacillus spiritus]|uniref:Response regulator n=1 Tax=Paenibacillus spiritus TaxID=2496557 RepID=A0A5J5G8N5_9BACL|nr:response regulator [Paenibacillus spiritus]KAA9004096.1 response regulator [Paenibacillus spiritus]
MRTPVERGTERYKALLVDDEPIILRSLRAAIPWEELRIGIVGEARNGEAALKLIEETAPDIVISDIRMPGIDGLSLMRDVLSANDRLLFIFISGYGEFEYAREALRMGAFDYLLKPIDHDELEVMLERAVEKLDTRRENDQLLHSARALSELARERLFAGLIEGRDGPLQQLKWLERGELEDSYFLIAVQLDGYAGLGSAWTDEEKRLWLFAIRNILEEWSTGWRGLALFPYHGGEWVLLFPGANPGTREEVAADLIETIRRYAKLSCSAGISREHAGLGQLSTAYAEASKALVRRFYDGPGRVYAPVEERGAAGSAAYPMDAERELAESVRQLDAARLRNGLNRFREALSAASATREQAERHLTELLVVLYRGLEEWTGSSPGSPDVLLDRLRRLGTLDEMMAEAAAELTAAIASAVHTVPKDDPRSIADKVRRFIESSYSKEIGVEEAAEVAGLSVSHFCTLFKNTTGYTFLEYLTHCRIEKAKYLLTSSEVKVYRIAPLVGYQDPRYFAQVFKKATGKTPTEYREAGTS